MLNKLKIKLWLLLTSPRIGLLIKYFFLKNGYIRTNAGYIKVGNKATKPVSLIFWGLYEREDIYFINKYLPLHLPVIEFGASLGLTTLNICKKIREQNVISVEANPNLYSNLIATKQKNNLINLEIISAALDYSNQPEINFSINDSTLSSSKNQSNSNVKVPTIKLSDVYDKIRNTSYSLVCDIEGAEIELLLCENNDEVISACHTLIIELHDTNFEGVKYDINSLSKMFKDKFSMQLIAQKGTTFCYKKHGK